MTQSIRLCLVLHNHQPIGNFDHVFEQAYQDSYLPFLEVFEPYEHLRIGLHTSGPLLDWLDQRHPEYLDRVAKLVSQGRIEILGGPYYEPILTMIPTVDRIGQIRQYTQRLESRLNADVRGMWMPERVWEQALTADVQEAGIQYTILDDYHFRNAGLTDGQLDGYYVTEEFGKTLSVFPGSERLRYLIPFGPPEHTVDYLRCIAEQRPNSVVVFGDDGEKFGTWPDTKHHVYTEGWLRRFFDQLTEHRNWLFTSTLAECVEQVTPLGGIYIPDASYREMTEWALPVERQIAYDALVHDMEHDDRWSRIKPFIRGGFWRNFKVKYHESNEMYARMMMVSQRLEQLDPKRAAADPQAFQAAKQALYQGQCNCSYWHGAFGGIYLPHLRNAVYQCLIRADNELDKLEGRSAPWVSAQVDDFNFDRRSEVCLASDRVTALLTPACGGQLYELDVKSIQHNLGATLMRRREAYHEKVLRGNSGNQGDVASIHDRIVFKQEGLDQRLQYDQHPRRSLVDHFYDEDVSLESIRRGEASERGDFVTGSYEARLRRNPDKIQVQLMRQGKAFGQLMRITKGLTLFAGSSQLEVVYLLEGLTPNEPRHFSVEFNFAGMPSGADDRFFTAGDQRLGRLESQLDLADSHELGLTDQWLGISVNLTANQPTQWWTYPIETVSQSEGGFELVHQSVVVQPHWLVVPDREGRWSVTFHLDLDTQAAEERQRELATVSNA